MYIDLINDEDVLTNRNMAKWMKVAVKSQKRAKNIPATSVMQQITRTQKPQLLQSHEWVAVTARLFFDDSLSELLGYLIWLRNKQRYSKLSLREAKKQGSKCIEKWRAHVFDCENFKNATKLYFHNKWKEK